MLLYSKNFDFVNQIQNNLLLSKGVCSNKDVLSCSPVRVCISIHAKGRKNRIFAKTLPIIHQFFLAYGLYPQVETYRGKEEIIKFFFKNTYSFNASDLTNRLLLPRFLKAKEKLKRRHIEGSRGTQFIIFNITPLVDFNCGDSYYLLLPDGKITVELV